MSETTFLDALSYCEVHGHNSILIDSYCIDIIGTRVNVEKCKKCGMKREIVDLRISETTQPSGEWE